MTNVTLVFTQNVDSIKLIKIGSIHVIRASELYSRASKAINPSSASLQVGPGDPLQLQLMSTLQISSVSLEIKDALEGGLWHCILLRSSLCFTPKSPGVPQSISATLSPPSLTSGHGRLENPNHCQTIYA